jgi:hypothetical protein
MLKSWLALLLAPSTALALQSVMYAMVTPECAQQARLWIHVAAGGGLLVAAVLAVLAWGEWRIHGAGMPQGPDSDAPDPRSTRRFVAVLGSAVAALSCLVIVSMWLAAWLLSPCSQH